ncbi:FliH/SctL family protein [Actinomycetaceae bacterium L2_0104]
MSSDPVDSTPRPVRFSTVPGGASAKARGYADGYAHGWAAGARAATEQAERERDAWSGELAREKAALAARVERALAVLGAAAHAARTRLAPVLEQSQETLAAGAVELAEVVLAAELSDHGVAVRSALSRAFQLEGPDRVVCVRLNPQDLAALEAMRELEGAQGTPQGMPQGTNGAEDSLRIPDDVELTADASLAPGDAMSELPEGMLDARIALAFARVREELGRGQDPAPGELA